MFYSFYSQCIKVNKQCITCTPWFSTELNYCVYVCMSKSKGTHTEAKLGAGLVVPLSVPEAATGAFIQVQDGVLVRDIQTWLLYHSTIHLTK